MFATEEARWFFKEENEYIGQWFNHHGLQFETNSHKMDICLNVKQDNIDIKLRQGNIEIKYRRQGPRARIKLSNASGYCEEWAKWNFVLGNPEILFHDIIKKGSEEWMEVIKNRLAIFLVADNGNLVLKKTFDQTDSGCQIEYTQLQIKNSIWYTFGFAWFGNHKMDLAPALVNEILGPSQLMLKESQGYAAFFCSNF